MSLEGEYVRKLARIDATIKSCFKKAGLEIDKDKAIFGQEENEIIVEPSDGD